jgi:hypothetical protein
MSPKSDHEVLRFVEKLLEQTMARQHPVRAAYYAFPTRFVRLKRPPTTCTGLKGM